ncbi:MAG: DeoR family transcriptional regulator [Chloroflexota bacterium]
MKSGTSNDKHNTRDVILDAIKATREATVEELAEAAEVSPVTVRHHLNTLQAEGLLVIKTIRRKVGRPHYVYGLSEKAQELFPQKYVRLSSRLLDELKAHFPAEVVAQLFNGVVQRVIEDHRLEFEGRPFEERLAFLVRLLEDEGFLARWNRAGNHYHLVEYSCPYVSVGQKHSEVCTFDTALIAGVLQTPILQHSCILDGADCCQFTFSAPTREMA